MKKCILALMLLLPLQAWAQYQEARPEQADSTLVLSLDDALKIALSENTSIKVADLEIKRQKYAQKGAYGALFPQISATGMYSYAIKKQKVFFGSDDTGSSNSGGGMSSMMEGLMDPIMYYIQQLYEATNTPFVVYVAPEKEGPGSSSEPIEMGRRNQVQLSVSAAMPLVNVQLWESLRLTKDYYAVLMAKASYNVYNAVLENAAHNLKLTENRYNVQKASAMDLARAQSSFAAAIPNLYNAENAIQLGLWQLKAVMGVALDTPVDVEGKLADYAETMFSDLVEGEESNLERNSQLRQLATQAEILARQIRMQQYAYLPTLNLSLTYNYYSQSDKFNLSQWKWLPSSTAVVTLSIPIFSGGQRYHTIKQTRVQADELQLQRENTERQLRISIRQNLNTMETAMKTYDAASEALKSAEKAYDIASKSYEVGKTTFTDLNNTELTLTQTRLQSAQAVYNFIVAKATLEQTLGYDFTQEK